MPWRTFGRDGWGGALFGMGGGTYPGGSVRSARVCGRGDTGSWCRADTVQPGELGHLDAVPVVETSGKDGAARYLHGNPWSVACVLRL